MNLDLQIMHSLAVQGMAEIDDLVDRVPEDDEAVRHSLESLKERDLIRENGFVYLTDEGETKLNELCRQRFSDADIERTEALFGTFEELDEELKEIAVRWQETDRSDESRVTERVEELSEFHDRISAAVERLDGTPRTEYEWYLDRLGDAVARIRDGEHEYFTGADVASYHNLWFAFHEDLLRTLGEERA